MIETRDLKKNFGDLIVLRGITQTIKKGEKVVIIGPSGSGKSTYLRCLNLLETPDSGEIYIDGVNILDKKININTIRQKMGMVFQHFNLFPHLTVLENITLAPVTLKLKTKEQAIEDAKETIEFLMSVYESEEGPLVYPVLLKDGTNVGYVQLVPIEEGFEVGYHIGKEYTGNGYATEALKAFLNEVMSKKNLENVYGVCVSENIASKKVLEKSGFVKEYEGMGEYQGENRQIVKYVFKRA